MKKCLLLCLILTGACGGEKKTPPRTIQVMGECLKKIHPDKASINFKVNNLRPTSQEAMSETQRTYKKLG